MVDKCDMRNFPPRKYFKQHDLPRTGPSGYDYDYTLPYAIRAEGAADNNGVITSLRFVLYSLWDSTTSPKGISRSEETWEAVLQRVLSRERPLLPDNPLDISIAEPSRVILRLDGSFWHFSQSADPVTTKYDLGRQYFDLQRHADGDGRTIGPNSVDYRCASFFSQQPCPRRLNVRHGFSLNLEFTSASGGEILPVTFDPDIQNTGGG
ncbi:MAG TPA: nucleotide synthetase [Allosphingosinicella sp.]